MRNFLLGLFLGLGISTVFAGNIPTPPTLPNEPAAEQHYFNEIYRNWNRLEVITSNPDGNRSGKKGDMLLLQTGGNTYLEINSDSSNTWLGVQLTNVP